MLDRLQMVYKPIATMVIMRWRGGGFVAVGVTFSGCCAFSGPAWVICILFAMHRFMSEATEAFDAAVVAMLLQEFCIRGMIAAKELARLVGVF